MDAKITKKRLGEFLSYEWIKVLAIIAAIVIVWSVVFSVTASRLTEDQLFTIINYTGTNIGEDFNAYPDLLMGKKNVLSYEVNEISTLDITVDNNSMASSLLETRLTTSEGDVLFAADAPYKGQVRPVVEQGAVVYDGDEIKTETSTYLYDFLISRYHYMTMSVEDVKYPTMAEPRKGIITQVDEYLAQFFTKDGEEYDETTLNKEEAEKQFRARVEETSDKRFRNEKLLEEGLEKEYARLQQYCVAFETFKDYLYGDSAKGLEPVIQATESNLVFSDDNGDPFVVTGKFSLNLCPVGGKMSELKDTVYYKTESGTTADNVNLVFLNLEGSQKEFYGEKLVFVNYLVERYLDDTM
ncbi:MAG: hypothetical protein IJY11_02975 [Clostridia bacterium]|nr:hypothetical protein [Clostridia bacterium]